MGLVKYLMTRREVTFVQSLQNAIADSEATEYQNGALQLLTDAEFLSFEGDSLIVPTEFDGIEAQVVGNTDAQHVIDMNGQPLDNIKSVNQAAAVIAGYGNFGVPTDLFRSVNVQADLDTYMDPALRVPLTEGPGAALTNGSPVQGIDSDNV